MNVSVSLGWLLLKPRQFVDGYEICQKVYSAQEELHVYFCPVNILVSNLLEAIDCLHSLRKLPEIYHFRARRNLGRVSFRSRLWDRYNCPH